MSVNYITHRFNPVDGYGLWAIEQVNELTRLGVNVLPVLNDTAQTMAYVPIWMRSLFGVSPDKVNIQLMPVNNFIRLDGRNIGYSMWEDDTIPDGWVSTINKTCDEFIATCDYYANVFRESGVNVPIHTVGGGIREDYPLLPHRDNRPFTFMCLADRGIRKGSEVVINAFRSAFARDNQDVRLIIKTREHGHEFRVITLSDKRITTWREDVENLSDVFVKADCYVYPSYGDGWGLTPRQAIAHGVPTIAPRHTGLAVGIDKWATCILETFERPKSFYGGDKARWFKPTVDETANAMKWVYENRESARQTALNGRKWLLNNQTWYHSALALNAVVEGVHA